MKTQFSAVSQTMDVTVYLSAVKLWTANRAKGTKSTWHLSSAAYKNHAAPLNDLNEQCDEVNLSNCRKTNTQTISSTSLRVGQDSAAASLSLQVQLLSWTPCSSVLQGGRSLVPQQRGNGGGGSARILHHQLLPIPGHWTVESGPSSCVCVSSQRPGQSIYTLTIPSCPAQVWAADFEPTLASLMMRENTAFFASRESKQPVLSFWIGTHSFFMLCLIVSFVHTTFNGQNLVTRKHLFSCLCNSSVCAQQLNLLPRVLPSRKPQQTQNALYHICTLLF